LNSEGGDLLVGINDDGDVTGIDEEVKKYYKNEDKYRLNFKNHIKSKIGEGFYPLVDYQIVKVDGKNVLRVSCGIANSPCFIEDKEFYVRSGPSTDLLEGKKQHEYIKERF
jgi:predicted HTH transcriptional regulator